MPWCFLNLQNIILSKGIWVDFACISNHGNLKVWPVLVSAWVLAHVSAVCQICLWHENISFKTYGTRAQGFYLVFMNWILYFRQRNELEILSSTICISLWYPHLTEEEYFCANNAVLLMATGIFFPPLFCYVTAQGFFQRSSMRRAGGLSPWLWIRSSCEKQCPGLDFWRSWGNFGPCTVCSFCLGCWPGFLPIEVSVFGLVVWSSKKRKNRDENSYRTNNW